MYLNKFVISIVLIGVYISCTQEGKKVKEKNQLSENQLFELISKEESKLDFNNQITENITGLENLFNYDYFYNGAGVGLDDINNDGLLDVFFCGNQVPNKLFINKGNMVFEDITNNANINNGKTWSNGVSFVDINLDGWMDIYISQGGPNKRLQRKNLLFINQKDNTFKESASTYGLADMGISTQSVFFDFDKDGDLDCLVMNENEYYGVDPITLKKLVGKNNESKYFNSSHLYRNDSGFFTDITNEAGIERPIFGLGLTVSDINDDGWLDIYIASDYYLPDALFINNRNGTFSDNIKEYTQHISFYGMGMDIADINNDLQQDIFVLDMASNDHVRSKTLMASMNTERFDFLVNQADFHHQYMYNSLQLNTGLNKFSNIAQSTKTANTDWSWSVLLADFDHDRDKDIYVTNGYRRYALDNDLQQKVYEAKLKYKNNVPIPIKKQLYESMPSEKLPNILFENKGNLDFKENAKGWGLAHNSFSNGSAMGDLDNDGDLDLVVNNMDEDCFLYKNLAVENNNGNFIIIKPNGNLSESYAKITIFHKDESQMIETRRIRGYRSSHEPIAHFGLGDFDKVDSLEVLWPSGKNEIRYNLMANTIYKVKEEDAQSKKLQKPIVPSTIFYEENAMSLGINFQHKENVYNDFEKEVLLPYKQSTLGPFVTKGDLNNDGLEDIFIGGASGQSGKIFIQNLSGEFENIPSSTLENDRNYEDMQAIFFDLDNDDDLDIYVVSGGNEFPQYSSYYSDRIYLNDGLGNLKKGYFPILEQNPKSGKSVTVIDFDQDGDSDIIVGNRIIPKNYPRPSSSTIYSNENGELVDVTEKVAPELANFGIVNDVIATDFNLDGWQDFIVVGEWTGIGLFENKRGTFKDIGSNNKKLNLNGWWFSVSETDINNDNLPDYIIGNVGTNLKFKASKTKPFKVYSNDFDANGTPDIVLSKKYNGEYVPVRGRECSSQQMPFIQEKFKTYSEFANARLVDIYGDQLSTAYEAEANEFKSIILINIGNGNFTYSYLPNETQLFPIMDTVFLDVNKDGFEDALVAGNIYNTEVETPRLDAICGTLLLSNGKDGYVASTMEKSGLLLNGNIKDLEIANTSRGELIMATQNNGPILTYTLRK